MNRGLRFRGWHEKDKVMSKPFMFSDLEYENWYPKEESIDALVIPNFPDEYDKANLFSQLDLDEIVLMRDMGVKDKNKREIYEGDIVKFDSGMKAIAHYNHNTVNCWKEYKKSIVIGNQFENPQLLSNAGD